jgi:hypothetical protein
MFQLKKITNPMKSSDLLKNVALILFTFCSMDSIAINVTDNAEIHGFASLGYINSSNNLFYGDTLDGRFDIQEIAVNGFWEPSESIRLSGQILYRNIGSISGKNINMDFLMADFKIWENEFNTTGIRLGRVKVPYGIYNSSRDVPHGRPGVFVPKAVYFDSFRDSILAVDGASVYGNLFNDWGNIDYQFYAGRRDINNNSMEHYLFSSDVEGSFDKADIKGLQFMLEPASVHGLKLGYSLFNVDMQLSNGSTNSATQMGQNYALQYILANAANPLSPTLDELGAAQGYAQQQLGQELSNNYRSYINNAELSAYMHTISAQYFWKAFTLTTEYLRANTKVTQDIAATGNTSTDTTTEGYYLQVEWQAKERLMLLARYEKLSLDTSDNKGVKGFESGVLLSPFTHFARGYTLGARWYFSSDLSITGEYSHNHGAAWLPKDDGINAAQLKEEWDYFALQLSYHF